MGKKRAHPFTYVILRERRRAADVTDTDLRIRCHLRAGDACTLADVALMSVDLRALQAELASVETMQRQRQEERYPGQHKSRRNFLRRRIAELQKLARAPYAGRTAVVLSPTRNGVELEVFVPTPCCVLEMATLVLCGRKSAAGGAFSVALQESHRRICGFVRKRVVLQVRRTAGTFNACARTRARAHAR